MFELFRDKLSNLKACASWVKGAHVYQMEQKLYILIGRASLVFILRDVTRFTPLLARLVQ